MRCRAPRFVIAAASLLLLDIGLPRIANGQCPPCEVHESGTPCEFVGVPCSKSLHLVGGFACLASDWQKLGSLPPGLDFADHMSFATVSGIPTTPGTFSCGVLVHIAHSAFCMYSAGLDFSIATALAPHPMAVDANAVTGTSSNTNGVLEQGETIQVAPSWENDLAAAEALTGTASAFTGPPGPTYTLIDDSADYGSVSVGATSDCNSATGNCYLVTLSGTRPAAHWDAKFTEQLSFSSLTKTWTLHVGESFPDVPVSNPSYAFVENLFHNGVTAGCGGGNYCPDDDVTRAQMAAFLLKAKHGAQYVPASCTGVFTDVACPSLFADWIEALHSEGITGGCGNGDYCPANPVTRGQMAVFLLKAAHDPGYVPPPCAATAFSDVPCPGAQFVDFINELAAEGITAGCGNGNYCPNDPVTRGQMAVFLVKMFGLQLYGS